MQQLGSKRVYDNFGVDVLLGLMNGCIAQKTNVNLPSLCSTDRTELGLLHEVKNVYIITYHIYKLPYKRYWYIGLGLSAKESGT